MPPAGLPNLEVASPATNGGRRSETMVVIPARGGGDDSSSLVTGFKKLDDSPVMRKSTPQNEIVFHNEEVFHSTNKSSREVGKHAKGSEGFLPWVLLFGMLGSSLVVFVVLLLRCNQAYFTWLGKQRTSINKQIVEGYTVQWHNFWFYGFPTGVFTLCALIYLHQYNGFLSYKVPFTSRLLGRLRRPFVHFTRWFSLGETLSIFFIVALACTWILLYVDYTFYRKSISTNAKQRAEADATTWLRSLARGAGWAGMLLSFFMLFPVARGAFWLKLVGLSFDGAVQYHRWLGRLSVLVFDFHGLLYAIYYALDNSFYARVIENEENFFGLLGCIAFTIIWITSLEYVRRNYFEVFYYSHFLFIAVIYFASLHIESLMMWWYPSLFLYIIFRVKTGVTMASFTAVKEFTYHPEDTIVALKLERSALPQHQYQAGQYVFVCVPAISAVQSHPFSISSSPSDDPNSFTIHAKALGGWTTKLAALLDQCNRTNTSPIVKVDGYYGSIPNYSTSGGKVVLIAGGIGATPVLSILKDCYNAVNSEEMTSSPCEEVIFHWVVRNESTVYPFIPLLNEILKRPDVFKVKIHVTHHNSGNVSSAAANEAVAQRIAAFANSAEGQRMIETNSTQIKLANKRKTKAFKPIVLSTWNDVLLHLLVWFFAYLSVMVMWYTIHYLNETHHTETPQGGHGEEFVPWWLGRILEPTLFGFFGLSLAFVLIRVKDKRAPASSLPSVPSTNGTLSLRAAQEKPVTSLEQALVVLGGGSVISSGRPDFEAIFDDIHKQDSSSCYHGFVSGPHGIHDSVKRATLKYPPSCFDVHFDEFQL